MTTIDASASGRRKACLVAILLLGLVLRLIGLKWGLPGDVNIGGGYYHPSYLGDETSWVMNVYYAYVGQKKLYDDMSVHLGHGPGAEYLNTLGLGIGVATGYLKKPSTAKADFAGQRNSYHKDQEAMGRIYVPPRLVAVTCGIIGIYVVYLLATALGGEIAGLWAAATLAVTPLHVVFSHYARSDGYAAFFVALTLWMAYRLYQHGRMRDYLLAGFVAGVMTSMKYPTWLFSLSLIVAHVLRKREQKPVSRKWLAGAFGMGVFGFCLFVPAAVFNPFAHRSFFYWIRINAKQIIDPKYLSEAKIDWWIGYGHEGVFKGLFGFAFPAVLTWTLYVVGIVAVVWCCVECARRRPAWLIVMIPTLAYFALALKSTWLIIRWKDMLMPSFALAVGLFAAADRPLLWRRVVKGVVAIALIHAALFSLAYVRGMSRVDTRSRAALWMEENARPNTTVGMVKPQFLTTQTRLNWEKFKFAEVFYDPKVLEDSRPAYFILHSADYRFYDLYPSFQTDMPVEVDFLRSFREERTYREVQRFTNEAALGPLKFPVGRVDAWDWPFQTLHIYERKDADEGGP